MTIRTVDMKIGGTTYTLEFGIDAMCFLEEILGRSFSSIYEEAKDPKQFRLSTMRAFLYAALREHHPGMTLQAAGALIFQAGGAEAASAALADAMLAGFGVPPDDAAQAKTNHGSDLTTEDETAAA